MLNFKELPVEIQEQFQHECDDIVDQYGPMNPEILYNNVVGSTGTVGSLSKIFGLPYGLVQKVKELNNMIAEKKKDE